MATEKSLGGMKIPLVVVLISFVIALILGAYIGRALGPASPTLTTFTTTTSTSLQTTSIPSNSTATLSGNLSENNTVTQVLYKNKTISLAPPRYNPNYNYVTGCYWIDGYYNFSFDAPYSGYIVFNQTNSGIPTNYTTAYLDLVVSTEKPRYVAASAYNGSYWCSGETVQSNVAPYTVVAPYNNQTMIIPVVSGINYFFFDNGNANQEYGVNPFRVNVTFSMKYYGFKNVSYPTQPPFNFNKTIKIQWGKYP